MKKILFKNHQSPGDIIMLTSAVRDLKAAQPTWSIGVDTVAMDIWDNNPHITKMLDNTDVEIIKVEYPLIHKSNEYPYHFIHAFRMFLEDHFQIKIPQGKFKGDIHLSDQECGWISQVEELGISDPYWIIMAGGKYDFTAKWWDPRDYQKVVDHFKGKMLFIQCGEKNHFHKSELSVVVALILGQQQDISPEVVRDYQYAVSFFWCCLSCYICNAFSNSSSYETWISV